MREAGRSFAAGLEGVPVFVVSGLSKIAGLPQMKAAWIVATGPAQAQALERLEVIADTFLSMNAPVQCALPRWLEGRAAIQGQIQGAGGGQPGGAGPATEPAIDRCSGWRWKAAGTRCCGFRRCSRTSRRCWQLLERGVWVHPGYFFGMAESGWLVVSLLGQEGEFSTGVTGTG